VQILERMDRYYEVVDRAGGRLLEGDTRDATAGQLAGSCAGE
jgi:hypothetical protein